MKNKRKNVNTFVAMVVLLVGAALAWTFQPNMVEAPLMVAMVAIAIVAGFAFGVHLERWRLTRQGDCPWYLKSGAIIEPWEVRCKAKAGYEAAVNLVRILSAYSPAAPEGNSVPPCLDSYDGRRAVLGVTETIQRAKDELFAILPSQHPFPYKVEVEVKIHDDDE